MGVAIVLGFAVAEAPAYEGPIQLIPSTPAAAALQTTPSDAVITHVAYPYRSYSYYGGPAPYSTGYRGYSGNYGGYYRPYYTRGWRDGYALPLGRRWGAF
ncbi:MAG: hypothetical protein C0483_08590 [Pirellula sp.]|nr:hypothetical protein [Pirellula sp.]